MKKKLLIIVPLVLVIAAASCWVYFESGLVQYPIFWAYQFPSDAELERIEDHQQKIEACTVPDEIIAQMSTDALLETFLTYPLMWNPVEQLLSQTSFSFWFKTMKTDHHFGLEELAQREDLCESILRGYKRIPLYKGKLDQSLDYDQKRVAYKKAYDDRDKMVYLELLAAVVDITGDEPAKVALREKFEQACKEKERYEVYGGPPYTTIYFYAAHVESVRKQMEAGTYGKKS